MQTTHRAHSSPAGPTRVPAELERERDARAEIDSLRDEIEDIVGVADDERARDAVDSALGAVTRLQVVTANLDACNPPSATYAGAALVALADRRLSGAPDAIERGMTYTADNQMRLLQTGTTTPKPGDPQ
jgi:hypothetical protein